MNINTEAIAHTQACKNCNQHFTGEFCNWCGQKEAHRITLGHVMHDLIHVFLHADKGYISLYEPFDGETGRYGKRICWG